MADPLKNIFNKLSAKDPYEELYSNMPKRNIVVPDKIKKAGIAIYWLSILALLAFCIASGYYRGAFAGNGNPAKPILIVLPIVLFILSLILGFLLRKLFRKFKQEDKWWDWFNVIPFIILMSYAAHPLPVATAVEEFYSQYINVN